MPFLYQHNLGAEQLVAVMDKTMMHLATMVSGDNNGGGDLPIKYQGENLSKYASLTSHMAYMKSKYDLS